MATTNATAADRTTDRRRQDQNQTDTAIVHDLGVEHKVFVTLQAEAALQGREVIALPDGRMLLCRWNWCRVYRNLRDLARALDKGMA